MLTPYRIEIFTRDFRFKGFAPLLETPMTEFDYLTLSNNTVAVQHVNADKGDYARIVNSNGILYSGIVTDTEVGKNTLELTITPFLTIFDTVYQFTDPATDTIENQLKSIIDEAFVNNADTVQNVTGLNVVVTSQTAGTLTTEENEANIYELLCSALKTYGIACRVELDVSNATLTATIGKINGAVMIEADLKNVLKASFTIGDSYGEKNKVIVQYTHDVETEVDGEIVKETVTDEKTFYKHPDGTIDDVNEDRIAPVIFSYENVMPREDQTFEEVALQKAIETLTTTYANEIEIQVARSDKLIPALEIGQVAHIIRNGTIYESILTGYEKTENVITYVFGAVRSTLTKKIKLIRKGL